MGRSDTYHAIIVAPARHRALGVARILFGLAWAVDAFFKWHPAFFNNFSSYLSGALQGQAPWVVSWLNFWIDMVKGTPSTFGIIVAIAETAIAIGLIFGLFSNIVDVGEESLPSSFGQPRRASEAPTRRDRPTSARRSSTPFSSLPSLQLEPGCAWEWTGC